MNESLLRFKRNQKYIIFDTETEGLNLIKSKPWQAAWIVVEGDRVIKKYDKLIHWDDLNVSPDAARITGFDKEYYKNNAEPAEKVWSEFSKAIATAIAKNAPVDKDNFIYWQYKWLNFRERGLKTSQLTLLKKYGITFDEKRLHDALYDIEMNFQIFRRQILEIEI